MLDLQPLFSARSPQDALDAWRATAAIASPAVLFGRCEAAAASSEGDKLGAALVSATRASLHANDERCAVDLLTGLLTFAARRLSTDVAFGPALAPVLQAAADRLAPTELRVGELGLLEKALGALLVPLVPLTAAKKVAPAALTALCSALIRRQHGVGGLLPEICKSVAVHEPSAEVGARTVHAHTPCTRLYPTP